MWNHISLLDKILFAKHLGVMLRAGLPLRQAIELLRGQMSGASMRRVLDVAALNLDNGEELGQSLAKHQRLFGPFFLNIIKVGEASGTLAENLEHLASHLKKNRELRRKIKSAMVYPIFILVTTLVLGFALTTFILPKLAPLFVGLKVQLPWATRVLMSVSFGAKQHGLSAGLATAGAIILLAFLSRLNFFKKISHHAVLATPVLSAMVKKYNLAQITRAMGILLQSGIPILDALRISKETVENRAYKKILSEAARHLESGKQLGDFLKTKRRLFPQETSNMVAVGESAGKLEETLLYLADFYEKEVDSATKDLPSVLEPILLIIIGIVVGFVAFAVIMPIYGLTKGIRG